MCKTALAHTTQQCHRVSKVAVLTIWHCLQRSHMLLLANMFQVLQSRWRCQRGAGVRLVRWYQLIREGVILRVLRRWRSSQVQLLL